MDVLYVVVWSLVGSVVSLVGGVLLAGVSKKREHFVRYALPFGAGALLAAAFLGLLPEALHTQDANTTAIWMLGGFLAFFVLERGLSWFHHHHQDHTTEVARDKTHTSLVIVGDTLHNAIDGVAIGAAFLVSPAAGVGTAMAVALHEIPQEVGDFGILLAKGMARSRVILVNVLSALATVVTALVTYVLGIAFVVDVSPLLAVAAGFFVYVAAADIIPDIHERPHHEATVQSALLLLGVVVIGGMILMTTHDHSSETTDRPVETLYHNTR